MTTYAEDSVPRVAIVYGEDGEVFDRCWSWEAGINYANSGYRVEAIADDGIVTMERAQRAYDRERVLAADCFGGGIRD